MQLHLGNNIRQLRRRDKRTQEALAEEIPHCSVDIAKQDYLTMAEDWPWWNVPEVEQVKAEIQADPRWNAWVESIQL